MAAHKGNTILTVSGLVKTYEVKRSLVSWLQGVPASRVAALDGVSFSLSRNEVLGIVGESGSGKSTVARCILRLEKPNRGTITFDEHDVWKAQPAGLRQIRRSMQAVFQDPYRSLNPSMTVRRAISEPALVHGLIGSDGIEALVNELLDRVGLSKSVADLRPRALSGGQRQRVAIARALALRPKVIIADEAVSALDVSIQAQILNLFNELVRDLNLSMIFISHQLSVITYLSNRVAVMYLGRIVETGNTAEVFARPRHPYTEALLKAHPRVDARRSSEPALKGEIPSPYAIPRGCRFNTRCPYAEPRCFRDEPSVTELSSGHQVWCHVLPKLAGMHD